MNAHTKFGSLDAYEKGGIEITGKETQGRYLFSNMFEVAADAEPCKKLPGEVTMRFALIALLLLGLLAAPALAQDRDEEALEALLERAKIQRACHEKHHRDVVGGAARLPAVQKPQPLLRERCR